MSDNDQLTESAELRQLRDSLSGIAMPGRPGLETITARGRAHRRRRLSGIAGLCVAGVAAAAALTLGLPGVLGPAPARGAGTIRTAAFTIVSNPDGTATLTLNPKELFDPTALQNDLASDGIPAKVTVGSFCSSDPGPDGFSRVVIPRVPWHDADAAPDPAEPLGKGATLTIDPAALPAGAELSFGDFKLASGQQQASFALIDANSFTCSTTPPDPSGPPGGMSVIFGG